MIDIDEIMYPQAKTSGVTLDKGKRQRARDYLCLVHWEWTCVVTASSEKTRNSAKFRKIRDSGYLNGTVWNSK